jgi:hypothetical protein
MQWDSKGGIHQSKNILSGNIIVVIYTIAHTVQRTEKLISDSGSEQNMQSKPYLPPSWILFCKMQRSMMQTNTAGGNERMKLK